MNKFYGQLEQDKFIFERYFKNKKAGISIECGAFDGIMESSTLFFEETLNWKCINIESSPPIFDLLKKNRPSSFNFNTGLGEEESILTFKHVIHPIHGVKFGNGSFNHNTEHKNILITEGCTFEEYDVKITTYNNLIDNFMYKNFPNKIIDLFVLDVEGFEIEVIQGMKNSSYLPNIFCVEFPHVGLDNINNELMKMGYSYDISENNNAYFIKNDTSLSTIFYGE